jgi:integrase
MNKPLNNVTKDDLRTFLEMVKTKYSLSTYSGFIKTIRRLFRDYLGKEELAKFRFPTIPFIPKIVNYKREDLQRFYYAIEHDIVRMMFLAYCVTGLRRNDIMFLMKSELYRDTRMIIKNNGSQTKRRWITFYNEELEKPLNEYLESRNDDNPRVFVVDKFKTFQKHWKIAQKKTGLSITPKDLRDWFCNEMIRLGVQECYIDAYCGRVPKTILRRFYVNYSPDILKEVYDKANLRLFS